MRANDVLLPGECRLLEVRDPGPDAVQRHLAELIDDRRGRRMQVSAEQRQLNDRRLRFRNAQPPRRPSGALALFWGHERGPGFQDQ
jgi:hypothetical protein